MTIFTAAIEQASDILWNSLLLFLLVGTGVFFTIRLRGVQLRRFGEGFHRVFGNFTLRGKKADDQGMSSFQALATAIAAQVGTGNITGCATALVMRRPGRACSGCGYRRSSAWRRFTPRPCWPSVIAPPSTAKSPAARRTTSARRSRAPLARCWQAYSR